MSKLFRALFCALLVLALLQTTNCGRSRGGGYPRHSGGLSGGGSGYLSSGHRTSGSHGYPPSSGLSGSHSGGGSSYPKSSSGLSGSHSAGSSSYPKSSSGLSGSGGGSSYPKSSSGLSGSNSGGSYPNSGHKTQTTNHHTTVINHNYHYTPPQQIRYSAPGQAPHSYPVYHGSPPNYVYQYKDSGSKYGTLLAGLALLNLGTLGASVYAASKAGSGSSSSSGSTYKAQPGEYCKFGIKKDNGDYEETRIDCNLISSFILQEEAKTPQQSSGTNSVVSTTVTNVTVVNITNGVPDTPQTTTEGTVLYKKLPDGSLVPVNITLPGEAPVNATQNNSTAANGTMTSSVTTITTTTTNTTNALDVKGDAIKVTPGMQCFVIRHSPDKNMKKTVPCGLLQSYADQSIKRNSAAKNLPTFTVLCAVVAFVFY